MVCTVDDKEGKYATIKGKLNINSLVLDLFKDDPRLMYENIKIFILVGAFAINFCPCRLEDELDSTAFTSEHPEKNPLEIKFRKDIVESYKPIVWADPRPISMLQNVSYLSNNHLFLLHILLCGLGVYT